MRPRPPPEAGLDHQTPPEPNKWNEDAVGACWTQESPGNINREEMDPYFLSADLHDMVESVVSVFVDEEAEGADDRHQGQHQLGVLLHAGHRPSLLPGTGGG